MPAQSVCQVMIGYFGICTCEKVAADADACYGQLVLHIHAIPFEQRSDFMVSRQHSDLSFANGPSKLR